MILPLTVREGLECVRRSWGLVLGNVVPALNTVTPKRCHGVLHPLQSAHPSNSQVMSLASPLFTMSSLSSFKARDLLISQDCKNPCNAGPGGHQDVPLPYSDNSVHQLFLSPTLDISFVGEPQPAWLPLRSLSFLRGAFQGTLVSLKRFHSSVSKNFRSSD